MANEQSVPRFCVVVNDEAQYSLWSADRESPAGWSVVGFQGSQEECLAYIREVWTDMRPRSLRESMDASRATTE